MIRRSGRNSALIIADVTFDCYRILGINRRCVKKRAVMFPAIKAMTQAHAVWLSGCHKSDFAAQATTSDFVHWFLPLKNCCAY